jgi:hypothetical protein
MISIMSVILFRAIWMPSGISTTNMGGGRHVKTQSGAPPLQNA